MKMSRLTQAAFGLLTVLVLALAPACDKKTSEDPEIRNLSQKAAELDKLSQKANVAGADQSRKLKEAGVNDVKPNAEMQLTDEQKAALEARIKAEKNSSYQALLQEVLDKDKEIKELNDKIGRLRAVLPKPDIAKDNDSHYGMALKFLKKRGVKEEQAKQLISRVLIMDKLAPGFEVYHFYNNGVYGSWVSQGKATISPTELQAEEKAKIEGERDEAKADASKKQEEIIDLAAQKAKLTAELDDLQAQKSAMIKEMEALNASNEAAKAKLNSLHYVVGDRKALEKDGVIIVPVFAKDRAGANWADGVFTKAMDLRSQDTIVITASEVGLKRVGKVSVIPGSLEKDVHYSLTISEDKASATVKLLKKDRFKNEKVVFAVAD